MFFLHYYLQKGFSLEYLLGLSSFEKLFYKASMGAEAEKEKEVSEAWRHLEDRVEQMRY